MAPQKSLVREFVNYCVTVSFLLYECNDTWFDGLRNKLEVS